MHLIIGVLFPPVFPFVAVTVVEPECEKSSATTYFWYRQALNITSSIDDTGGLNWKMTLSLLVAWIMVCLAVIKGIQSSGKVQGSTELTKQGLNLLTIEIRILNSFIHNTDPE